MAITKRSVYTPVEVATLIGMHVDTLRRRVKDDDYQVYGIPVIRNGWRWRVPAGKLNDALGLTWREADEILRAAQTEQDAA